MPTRLQAIAFLMLFCGIFPLCGCNSKASPSVEQTAIATKTGSDQKTPDVADGSSIAMGSKAAAEFGKRHETHAGMTDLKTWRTVSRFGMTVRYPPDWQLNTSVPANGPIALNTFQSHYSERGGHFPSHGAEIDISYLPNPVGSAQQVAAADLKGSAGLKIEDSSISVGGVKTVRASYSDSFKGYMTQQVVAMYVEQGSGLYKFFLTYHSGEAWGPDFESDFDDILKTVKF
jgi:hypothetical protein